jgi:protocatechuate 4,5-dioxygenase beta chain
VREALVGEIVQPASAGEETAVRLDEYAARIERAFDELGRRIQEAKLDALIVLVSDTGRCFDESNTPQLHVFVGDAIWGDAAYLALGESPQHVDLRCDPVLGNLIADELAHAGFDVSESRGAFRPAGDAERGATAALVEPLRRLAPGLPIVPVHVNCTVVPCILGRRMSPLGTALARALALVPQRVGILASGGLSGDPGGTMAGWIDDVLDRWMLDRLLTRRSADLGGIFEMDSLTLRGATGQIRLWNAAGAAMEEANARARLIDYIPLHHSSVGCAFMTWE